MGIDEIKEQAKALLIEHTTTDDVEVLSNKGAELLELFQTSGDPVVQERAQVYQEAASMLAEQLGGYVGPAGRYKPAGS